MPAATAHQVAHLPPVSILFAAFLGYNPIQHLVGNHVLAQLPVRQHALVMGRGFFPQLISGPFRNGLHAAFAFAIVACLVAAAASWLRGGNGAPAGESVAPGPARRARTRGEQHAETTVAR